MEPLPSPKSAARTVRTHVVTESLTDPQMQRLERLFENAPMSKSNNWDRNRNDADVINGNKLLNIRSMHTQRRRSKTRPSLDNRIVINVCGSRYETHRTTLELYPDTLLGNAKHRKYYYDKHRKEYFFDRHRASFEAILYYYQSYGRLRRPDYVSIDIFLEEMTFFQLGQEAINQIRKDENIIEFKKVRLPKNRIRRFVWATMEYPDYSLLAKVVNIISLLMILISTGVLAVESLPQYVSFDDLTCHAQTVETSSSNNTTYANSNSDVDACNGMYVSPFFLMQAICVGFFTIELILRTVATPSLLDFIKNLMNWIDLIAIIPFYITIGIHLSRQSNHISSHTYVGLRLLRILRLVRIFKFGRVFKSVKSLRVLATTVRQSLLDFLTMISILTLLGFLFGAATYYAENDSNGLVYDSIAKATYWGIVTVTSVGYGDMTPITPIGRVLACLCALFGAATIGMLVSVLVDRYQRVYTRKLYIKEEPIEFDDDSDFENNEPNIRNSTFIAKHRLNSKIEDPDARAIENARLENNNITETPPISNSQTEIDGDSITGPTSNQIHFVIGFVDNENHETSHDLVSKISSIVADKQSHGDTISLNIISTENPLFDPQVQPESSDDESSTETSDEKVLKTFQRSSCRSDKQLNLSEQNV